MLIQEDWCEIEEFPGYSISNHGRVRNDIRDRLLQQLVTSRGVYVGLSKNMVQHNRMTARLVAGAFLPLPEDPQFKITFDTPINVDGDRTNNWVTNLMWRPRWFAVKYRRQFNRVWESDANIECVEHGSRFMNALAAAQAYGLLATEVLIAALRFDYYEPRETAVWPTGQHFRIVHNKRRRIRGI